MVERSRSFLFRKRTILGGVLVAGVFLGTYLGKFNFPGFGLGNGWGPGGGTPEASTGTGTDIVGSDGGNNSEEKPAAKPISNEPRKVIRVLIDDQNYYLQEGKSNTPVALGKLIDLVKSATGDEDGIRIRIKENPNMRMSREEDLKNALSAANIPDSAILYIPGGPEK